MDRAHANQPAMVINALDRVSVRPSSQTTAAGSSILAAYGRDVLALVPKHKEAADAFAFRNPGA